MKRILLPLAAMAAVMSAQGAATAPMMPRTGEPPRGSGEQIGREIRVQIRLFPSAVDIQEDTRDVTFDVILALKEVG